MRILELCLSPDLGGLELYVYRASLALNKTDDVLAVISNKGKLAERFKDSGVKQSYLEKGFKLFPLKGAIKLARLIDKNNIDVIHMHWGRDLALAALAKRISKVKPRLVYTRQMQITRNKDDFYHRFLYGEVNVFITITKALAKLSRLFLSQADKDKVVPLYYGVQEPEKLISQNEKNDLKHEMGFSESDFIVAVFGRIEEYKGQHVVINAVSEVNKLGLPVKGLVVGHAMDDGYLIKLKQQVSENKLDDDIQFMDFVENPQRWMQACDIVVLATKEETFGLVLAEAMQAGVAVIGTNSGGVPEIIEPGKNGYLFEYGDVKALSNYIIDLKSNPDKVIKFALAGKEKAKQLFDVNNHYIELRKLLSNLH